jgi:probable HAF family extracellular repeat protein
LCANPAGKPIFTAGGDKAYKSPVMRCTTFIFQQRLRAPLFLAALACTIGNTRSTAAPAYSVKDLGQGFTPIAINARDQIVGNEATSDGEAAFLLDGDVSTPILSPDGQKVWVHAINNLGQVVGASIDAVGNDHAFVWDLKSGWRNLEPTGIAYSFAYGVNDSGVVVGQLNSEAAMWQTDGQIIHLGDLGGQYGYALAVNSAGDVVGMSALDPAGLKQHAFIWHQGAMQDLDVTDAIPQGHQEYAGANGINDRGQVVGSGEVINNTTRLGPFGPTYGFVWTETNGLQSFVQDINIVGINDAGQAVGELTKNGSPTWNAMLYQSGVIYNLNDLIGPETGVRIMEAMGINDTGQIIAWGHASPDDPDMHGYLLTPVPEPTAYCMVVSLLVVGGCSRRRRAH